MTRAAPTLSDDLSADRRPHRRQLLAWGAAAAVYASVRPSAASAGMVGPKLNRGLNIHHVMNWPDATSGRGDTVYTWPPFSQPRFRIETWELQRIRKLGFDFIRLTVDPAIFLASDETRRQDLKKVLLDRIGLLLSHDLNVIVDMAPVAQNPKFAPAEIASNPAIFDAYCASAAQIAQDLLVLPQNRIVFEPINEPILPAAELGKWQSMLERMHQQIRAVAPDMPIVLTGAMWGHFKALVRLDCRPFRGSNAFYTFHYYDPHAFTHQAVDKEVERYITGLGWPPTEPQADVLARAEAAIAADRKLDPAMRDKWMQTTRKVISDYYATKPSAQAIETDFNIVAEWAARNGISNDRILVGEFGMTRAGGASPEDRANWLQAVRAASESRGFPWALWAYRGWGGMALADDTPARALDEPVLSALRMKL